MDTSKEYIEMCEVAKEIQDQWKPDIGDWFLTDFRGTTGFSRDVENQIWGDDKKKWEKIQCLTYKPSIKEYIEISDSNGSYTYTMSEFFKHRHVFLPRQDQLQSMIASKYENSMYMMLGIVNLMKCDFKKWNLQSMEQLWIMFIMHHHGKRWDGKTWVDLG